MAVRVEFYGIARQRAGTSQLAIEIPQAGISLGMALDQIAGALPDFSSCLEGGRLHSTLTANLDGHQFISDPAATIRDDQTLLILSADAGG